MMSKRSINPREIIRLLSKLKSETPEYPAELLDARKAAFLKQAVTLKIEGKGQGGEGGQEGGTGGAGGSALGGGTAAQGFLLQALVGFLVVAALLLTAFAYREQIGEILKNGNNLVAIAETGTAPVLTTPTALATVSPGLTGSPTAVTPTSTPTGVELISVEGITVIDGTLYVDGIPAITGTPGGTKPNPGLHLGQTPGTPAAPGQGNPGNQNQPDKPDRPDNPGNPGNSNNPGNPNKPE